MKSVSGSAGVWN